MSSPPPSLLTPLINSGDCNIMLAAVLSLLLVIFFVLLLHVYSRWFLSRSIRRQTNSQFHPNHNNNLSRGSRPRRERRSYSDYPTKGLELSEISSIPLFTHKSSEFVSVLECIVCLSAFEDGELGKKLRNCGHQFHIDCIDMWLYSHTSCPICREPVICKLLGGIKGGEVAEIVMEIRDENVMVCDSSASSSSSDKRIAIKNGDFEVKTHSLSDEIELDA